MKNINHSSAAFCMQPQLFPSTHRQRQKPDVLRLIKAIMDLMTKKP